MTTANRTHFIYTGEDGHHNSTNAILDWQPTNYEAAFDQEIEDQHAYIDALTQIGGLQSRARTIGLIKVHSKMRETFFTSTPIISNDLFPQLEGASVGHYFLTPSARLQSSKTNQSTNITAIGSYEQPTSSLGKLHSRFAILRKTVNDEAGHPMVLRYPLWMIDNKIINLLSEYHALDLTKDLAVLVKPAIHDMIVHSSVRNFDEEHPSVNPILKAWSEQIDAPSNLDAGTFNYEYFATLLHYQIAQKTMQNHPSLKQDYEAEICTFTTKLEALKKQIKESSGNEILANEVTDYLAANAMRGIAYILPKNDIAVKHLLNAFPDAYEQTRITFLYDRAHTTNMVNIKSSEHQIAVETLTEAFFRGLELELSSKKICPVHVMANLHELFGNTQCPASKVFETEAKSHLCNPKKKIHVGQNDWTTVFKNRLVDEPEKVGSTTSPVHEGKLDPRYKQI